MEPKDQVLEVWGDFACFSRPELKVERFSYPVITPSAARGIFDSIFCKPGRDPTEAQFRWQITQIEVLKEPSYIALRRNEVKEKISTRNVGQWMKGSKEPEPIFADATGKAKGRTQRQTMALDGVHYRIHGEVRPWPHWDGPIQQLEAQFRQRASRGKCFQQPYLGCREFPAYFRLIDPHEDVEPPADYNADIGLMLYDVFDLSEPGTSDSEASVSLFHARVEDGVLEVPEYDDPGVIKNAGGDR